MIYKATDMSDDRPAGPAPLEREAYDWMRRFASGAARPADLAALRQWSARSSAHREAFDRVSRTWQELGSVGDHFPGRHAFQPAPRSPSVRRRALLGGALAASAAGAAAMIVRP